MQFLTLSLLVTAATTALAAPSNLAERQLFSNIRSDVERKAACKAYTVIFARGTTEFGNVGDIAGPPFFNTLDYAIGTVAVQGVEYPADVSPSSEKNSHAKHILTIDIRSPVSWLEDPTPELSPRPRSPLRP